MDRIRIACERAGRSPDDVHLLPVSKTFPPEKICEAVECGITVVAENKVQEAAAKKSRCPGHLRWHMVGHLQRNKVSQAVELFDMIHSVDSLRLLETIDRASQEAGTVMPVLLEVNIAAERSKYGLSPEDLPGVLKASNGMMSVEVRGLMTMPPFLDQPEEVRPFFRRLRSLRDEQSASLGIPLTDLSMGMTHDFEVAVEEGSTWVRVGTALFGPRGASR